MLFSTPITSPPVVVSRQSRVYRFDPPPNPRLRQGLMSEPALLCVFGIPLRRNIDNCLKFSQFFCKIKKSFYLCTPHVPFSESDMQPIENDETIKTR